MVKIVEAIRSVLQAPSPDELVQAALSALGVVSSTMNIGEEYVLTTTVPIVIRRIQQRQTAAPSLSALLNLMCVLVKSFADTASNTKTRIRQRLGPRIIPFFKDLVKECSNVLADDTSQAHADATSVLQALLASIPNFWSSGDILLIIELYLRSDATVAQRPKTHLTGFVKTLAKRGSSKVLLPTLCDSWTRLAAVEVRSRYSPVLAGELTEILACSYSGFGLPVRRTKSHPTQ